MSQQNVNIVSQAREYIANARALLKQGMSVEISSITRDGELQIEIRNEGFLVWRAWTFEPRFLSDLELHIKQVSLSVPLTTDQMKDLYNYVVTHGKGTNSIEPPDVPYNAKAITILTKGPDVYTVWLVDGWPAIATDELCMCSWVL